MSPLMSPPINALCPCTCPPPPPPQCVNGLGKTLQLLAYPEVRRRIFLGIDLWRTETRGKDHLRTRNFKFRYCSTHQLMTRQLLKVKLYFFKKCCLKLRTLKSRSVHTTHVWIQLFSSIVSADTNVVWTGPQIAKYCVALSQDQNYKWCHLQWIFFLSN